MLSESFSVDDILKAWDGRVETLIEELLKERQDLIRQLELTSAAMSYGYVRGWKPNVPEY